MLALFLGDLYGQEYIHPTPALELQGHRGARGLLPENSLPAFERALELGVTTLELDSALTRDGHLVIYHDTRINTELCVNPTGEILRPDLISEVDQSFVTSLDCGSKPHPRFPSQQRISTSPPRLIDVLQLEKHLGRTPLYNLELKVDPTHESATRARLVRALSAELEAVRSLFPTLEARLTIQSFDLELLRWVHLAHPHLRRSALFAPPYAENGIQEAALPEARDRALQHAKDLGVAIISPHFSFVDQSFITQARALNIRVIPWTVNDPERMRSLILLGVDGLISDYPDRLIRVINQQRREIRCRVNHRDHLCKHPL